MKLNIQLFASGTIDGSSTASNADCRIVWTSTPNNEENYSVVTVEAQLYKSGSSSTTGTFSGVVNVNDTEYAISKKFSPYRWGNWVTVGTVSVTIPHNSDGTKSINISTYFSNSGTSMAGSYSTPYPTYVTLDTIPRGSTFNTSSWNRDTQRLLNSTLSFPATQNVSGVYHKLQARFMNNGTETTICTRTGVSITNGAISFSFTNAEQQAIYNLMPNETTHYIRMYLYTYTNSSYTNQLGDVSILWWTGLIPTNIKPTASLTYTEGGDVPNTWNVWVKGKSKINYTLTGTGIYGSTITTYSLAGDGFTYNTSTGLTNYLSAAGNITFTGSVTDTRQRVGTTTQTFSVLDYYNPSFTTTQVQRCDVNGNIDDNGEYLYYNFAGSISSCGGNNKANTTYKIGYRVQNTGTYTYVTIDSNKDSINASGVLSGVTFNTSTTYDIQFAIQDTFTTSTSLQTLDTGFDLMNFNPSGKSMAIGKVSEASANEKKLEIAMDTEVDGKVEATGSLITTGNDTGVICDNQNASTPRKTKYTVSGGGNAGIYDMTNSNWIIQSATNQNVSIPHNLGVTGTISASSTITTNGNLTSSKSGKYITISNENTSFAHYQTDAASGHWFNKNVYVQGNIYAGSSYNMSVPVMKELYSNNSGSTSVNIGESTSNYSFYIIVWGIAIDEKRADIFFPGFNNFDFTQFATTGYWCVDRFTNSGNNISMSRRNGAGWGNAEKMYKIIGVKF